jgi:hypothetical protein
MEVGLDTLLGWQTVLLALGVYAFCVTLRKLLEGLFRKYALATNSYWRDVLLPVLPPLAGAIWGAVNLKYPYPVGLNGRMSHALYGLVCGFFSALIYRIVKSLMVKKWGIQLDDLSRLSGDGVKSDGAGSPLE